MATTVQVYKFENVDRRTVKEEGRLFGVVDCPGDLEIFNNAFSLQYHLGYFLNGESLSYETAMEKLGATWLPWLGEWEF